MITCGSDNKDSKGGDYYLKKIKIDWKGWKTFTIPFKIFGKTRKPLGWNQIDYLYFNFKGWGIKHNPNGKYYFDDIKLLSKVPTKK